MMKLITRLLYCLVLLSNYADAHTELSKPAIGFIYLQDFHKDRPIHQFKSGGYDPALISRGVSLYGEMGSVPLTAFEYIQLKSVYLGDTRQHMAYVFEQRGERYQLRTDESQFLWVRKNDTVGYTALEDILLDSCVYLDITAGGETKIATSPNNVRVPVRSWSEVIDQRVFRIVELKRTDGELWVRIAPTWYEQWHSKTNIKKTDTVFESSRWAVVHDVDGLLGFQVIGTGKSCG